MPTRTKGSKNHRYKALDLDKLHTLFKHVLLIPHEIIGMENPTTRPDEGAERSARFGRQLGTIETMLYMLKTKHELISPQLWTGRLGVPGKTDPDSIPLRVKLFDTYYPGYQDIYRGPKGGVKDGRLDALLIAHWLRIRTMGGMQSVVDRFGRDSKEAMALVLGGGRRKKRTKKT